jgi:hypothetical protein
LPSNGSVNTLQPRTHERNDGESDRFYSLQKEANRKTDLEEIRAGQEEMASLVSPIEANQAKTDLNLKEKKEEINSGQAEMSSIVSAIAENMGASIHFIQTELEETIRHRMEDVLSCVDEKKQGLRNELAETNGPTDSKDILRCANKRLPGNHNRHKGALPNRALFLPGQTRTIRDTVIINQGSMEEKSEATSFEFQSQLEEIEAKAEGGRGTRAFARVAQTPTFDGTTSWTVFQRQFETLAEHSYWSHQKKSTYLITALKGRAADVLHGIPTNATIPSGPRGPPRRSTLLRRF